MEDSDGNFFNYEVSLAILSFCCNTLWEPLVHTAVLKLVYHELQIHERVVPGLGGHVWVGGYCSEHQPANTAEAIDSQSGCHGY